MQDDKRKAKEILKHAESIGTGMFASMRNDKRLVTRPMHLAHIDEEHALWFFSRIDAEITDDIETHPDVSVGFASPERNCYVAVQGKAQTVIDSEKRAELWSPLLRSWFPQGVDDPQCILIKVRPETLESWEGSAWRIVQLTEQVLAIALGKIASPNEHVTVHTA